MAVVKTLSTVVTNRDAVPAVINDARLRGGTLKSGVGSVAVGAADSATSFYPLVEVPSTAMVRAVLVTAPAGMTTLAGNIGVFKTTKNAAGVTTGVAANTSSDTIFAAAQSLATAQNRTDVTNANSNAYGTDKREQPLWQAIGLASDPGGTFDIGIAVTTANTGAAGRVGIEVQYVDNSN
ncbi:hypothetical protein UFOVP16_36 [uncultured Caudovirales phage]|uniref:Uncharacterized protein n=1 Tax=uncultured Caudovirales phage TaxID=2100421 RepID=A0A6J5KPD0_9CAUD|nr:hypothetical protein UFOVP16_36 [uncultured Caudovirales phage]